MKSFREYLKESTSFKRGDKVSFEFGPKRERKQGTIFSIIQGKYAKIIFDNEDMVVEKSFDEIQKA